MERGTEIGGPKNWTTARSSHVHAAGPNIRNSSEDADGSSSLCIVLSVDAHIMVARTRNICLVQFFGIEDPNIHELTLRNWSVGGYNAACPRAQVICLVICLAGGIPLLTDGNELGCLGCVRVLLALVHRQHPPPWLDFDGFRFNSNEQDPGHGP